MLFGLTYYEICSDFLIYSFLGWVLEVVYHAVCKGKIVNRGFLNGPVCPVYGFGVVGFLMVLKSLNPSGAIEHTGIVMLFAGGAIFCSAIELFAGWLLDRLFHMRWWDYSNEPFNLHGYICLRFCLLWGAACVIVFGILYPTVSEISSFGVPQKYGWIIMLVLYIIYFADLVITVSTIVGLNRKLQEIDRLKQSMRTVSDRMTDRIGTSAVKAGEKLTETAVQASLAKEDLHDMASALRTDLSSMRHDISENVSVYNEDLKNRKEEAALKIQQLQIELQLETSRKSSVLRRMLKAFPNLHSHISHETMVDLETQLETAEKLMKQPEQNAESSDNNRK